VQAYRKLVKFLHKRTFEWRKFCFCRHTVWLPAISCSTWLLNNVACVPICRNVCRIYQITYWMPAEIHALWFPAESGMLSVFIVSFPWTIYWNMETTRFHAVCDLCLWHLQFVPLCMCLPVVWPHISLDTNSRPSFLPLKQAVMHSGMHEYYTYRKCDKYFILHSLRARGPRDRIAVGGEIFRTCPSGPRST